jgi:hypothetical protein
VRVAQADDGRTEDVAGGLEDDIGPLAERAGLAPRDGIDAPDRVRPLALGVEGAGGTVFAEAVPVRVLGVTLP